MANPKGRPAPKGNQFAKGREMPEGQIAEVKLTTVQLRTIILKYLRMTKTEILSVYNDHATPMLDLYVLSIMITGVKGGDDKRFETLLNRTLGKVADKLEVEDKTDYSEIERLKSEYMKIAKKPK